MYTECDKDNIKDWNGSGLIQFQDFFLYFIESNKILNLIKIFTLKKHNITSRVNTKY